MAAGVGDGRGLSLRAARSGAVTSAALTPVSLGGPKSQLTFPSQPSAPEPDAGAARGALGNFLCEGTDSRSLLALSSVSERGSSPGAPRGGITGNGSTGRAGILAREPPGMDWKSFHVQPECSHQMEAAGMDGGKGKGIVPIRWRAQKRRRNCFHLMEGTGMEAKERELFPLDGGHRDGGRGKGLVPWDEGHREGGKAEGREGLCRRPGMTREQPGNGAGSRVTHSAPVGECSKSSFAKSSGAGAGRPLPLPDPRE